jgi:hypothetical protein
LLVPAAGAAQVQINQTFVPLGPSPNFGPTAVVQSGDAAPNGTVSGAVQALVLDPALGPNTMFIASRNGGIWSTTDGGTTWTPLTDKQASLSIASLGLDPTDTSGKTLIAGTGSRPTASGIISTAPIAREAVASKRACCIRPMAVIVGHRWVLPNWVGTA